MAFLEWGAQRIEYERINGPETHGPTLVFLHEGLGSVGLWKDFPRQVASRTGCKTLIYSRFGYGHSTPLTAARQPQFMHQEALLVLPRILDELEIDNPVLFGHSDGASIALIHAGSAARPVRGLIVMAPHVMIEPVCIDSIAAAKRTYETTNWREKLRRYHADPDGAFWGWCNIWLDARFLTWNIEEHLRKITCPILAIQGFEDEYGSMEQVDRIKRQTPATEILKLSACGHSPHRDQPAVVLEAVHGYIEKLKRA